MTVQRPKWRTSFLYGVIFFVAWPVLIIIAALVMHFINGGVGAIIAGAGVVSLITGIVFLVKGLIQYLARPSTV